GKSRGDRMARAPEAIVWSRTMKPASFSYASCDTVQEAMQLLAEHGDDARVIAGGQSLMPMLNMRLVRPAVVVDIAAIAALNYAKEESGFVEFGAALTQSGAETWPRLRETVPLLALAFPHIGHIQTRNRGTVCGSLCHADPSSELPLVLATLGGEVVLQSKAGRRVLKASEFQVGMLTTARRSAEIAVAARLPLRKPATGPAFS